MMPEQRHDSVNTLNAHEYKGVLVQTDAHGLRADCMASGCGATYEPPRSYNEEEQALLVQDWVAEHNVKHILRLA